MERAEARALAETCITPGEVQLSYTCWIIREALGCGVGGGESACGKTVNGAGRTSFRLHFNHSYRLAENVSVLPLTIYPHIPPSVTTGVG